MTRREIVAFEGKPTMDKRLLLPGSITMTEDSIPVTIGPAMGLDIPKVVGKATDMERDDETGAISLEIHTHDELPEKLNGHILCTGMTYHTEDKVMVIESARLRQIYFSEAPQGWSVLDYKQKLTKEMNKLQKTDDEEIIKKVAEFINSHASGTYSGRKDGVKGLNCGCKLFIPLAEAAKEGADYAYSLHLAKTLYNEGLIHNE